MLPTEHLLAFTITCVVVILVPGPSVLFTVGRALSLGRRSALLSVLGNEVGLYLQVVLVALGLGALVATSATAYTAVRIGGALYLVWLGIQAIRHRHALANLRAEPTAADRSRVFRQGLIVGFTNPKMIVFLTAVLPQFTTGKAVAGQILVLGLILVVVALVCDSLWALAAGAVREWFAHAPHRVERIGGAGGVAMIGLGTGLLLTGRHD